jgi:hypothetical protein
VNENGCRERARAIRNMRIQRESDSIDLRVYDIREFGSSGMEAGQYNQEEACHSANYTAQFAIVSHRYSDHS